MRHIIRMLCMMYCVIVRGLGRNFEVVTWPTVMKKSSYAQNHPPLLHVSHYHQLITISHVHQAEKLFFFDLSEGQFLIEKYMYLIKTSRDWWGNMSGESMLFLYFLDVYFLSHQELALTLQDRSKW